MTEIDVTVMLDSEWETCVSAGIALAADMDARRFEMGDLGAVVVTRYGDGSLAKFAGEIGMARTNTLRQYVRVARGYPPGIRIQYLEAGLNWSHFRVALADADRAEYWLAKAADDGLPVAALGRAIKEATGLPVPPRLLYSGRGVVWQYANDSRPYLVLHEDVSALVQGLAVTIKVYEAEAQS